MVDEHRKCLIPFPKLQVDRIDQDQFGFSFISGVPTTPEATEKLIERIGFIRETQCKCSLSINLYLC